MKRSKPVKEYGIGNRDDNGDGNEGWQLSYLDTLTVLLCMMIILASLYGQSELTEQEPGKFETVDEDKNFPFMVSWDIRELEEELAALLSEELSSEKLQMETGEYEVRMQFAGSTFFNQGEADLLPAGQELIQRIIGKLAGWKRQDFKIDIEGHTDAAPIQTLQFPSNWELSAARASGVVRYFLALGIPSQKLKASGYADAFPLKIEKDLEGKNIPANQEYNRRIVLRLYFD
jgi:chemotaxis protein MotB